MKTSKHSTPISRTALFAVAAMFALSCERTIEIDLPIMDPVLVLTGNMAYNPSEYTENLPELYFLASKSGNPLSARFNPEFFDDVQAELWANGSFVADFEAEPSTIENNSWIYVVDGFEPQPGTNYQIRASKNGLDPVTVDIHLPTETPISTARWQNRENGVLRFTFKDQGQKRRFYVIRMYTRESNQAIPIFFGSLDGDVQIQDFFGSPFEFEIPTGREGLMINDNFRGQEKTVLIELPKELGLVGGIDTNNVFVELFSINEDTYRYNMTEQAYQNTRGNPFAEPVNMHVNVKGGLGFIGGSVRTERRVE